ncbi:MAG TPA: single-stranded-DNA-specific exonuclease RecJ [Terriglobales bacterium]|nr:single-stranded-DNA-specific exonuclease RecJ [Terriglobales bacterium]
MRWQRRAAAPDPALVSSLCQSAGLDPLPARILVARGISTPEAARRYLAPSLSDLHSPFAMSGMQQALARLEAAIARKEPIFIYGDYDVDGTVAIVILKTAIELAGGVAGFHIPHRIRDGYGMKDSVIEQAARDGVRLVVSVDTGIRAFAAAEAARRAGVDLIVTDHHLPHPEEGVPEAFAVLNPNQPGCAYPSKSLCGAGVAFKMAQALLEKIGRERLLPSFLKMVALATIADAVPLEGENRVFARLGLEGLRTPANAGLKALMEVASLDGRRPLTTSDVAFRLAPRINAAGRMQIAHDVVELFSARDQARARELAARLDALNAERQQEERRIVEEAFQRLEEDRALRESYCLVVDGEGWHRGVIGIVATRVVERYNRPTLVVSREGEEAHGSGRSIHAFHLLDALESCRQLFTRYGGHAYAVGFALPSARIGELRAAMNAHARARLTEDDFVPVLKYDDELRLDDVTPALYRSLAPLEPFGVGNPQPVFVARDVRILQPPQVLKEKHLKLRVAQPDSEGRIRRAFDALGWRRAEKATELAAGDVVDLAFTVEGNSHPEFGGLQLNVADVTKPS